MSKIAGVYYNDTANAEGICISVYLSGCDIHCPNCHNQKLQDFDYGVSFTQEKAIEICSHLMDNGIKRNLCVLGGEPLNSANYEATALLCHLAKQAGAKVYIWTGYLIENLMTAAKENSTLWRLLTEDCDFVIDGPYIESLRDITLKMRGSSNQRIISMKDLTFSETCDIINYKEKGES